MSNLAFDEYESKYQAHHELEAETLPRNKAVLFDALAAAGIATVTVEFEGSGDSGQMEKPCARAADETVIDLPSQAVEIERVDWNLGPLKEQLALPDAVEIMAWGLLGEAHGGWENDDGGYGEFTFDVAELSIKLEYHERYTETNTYEHEF